MVSQDIFAPWASSLMFSTQGPLALRLKFSSSSTGGCCDGRPSVLTITKTLRSFSGNGIGGPSPQAVGAWKSC